MTQQNPEPAQWKALKKIVKRLPAHLAYYGSALGAIVIAGSGAEGMTSIVGGIGAGLLTNLIAEVAKGDDLLDDDIRQRAEEAVTKSDIERLLTERDFWRGYVQLIRRLDAQKAASQDIIDELRDGFSKVATVAQLEEVKELIQQLLGQQPQRTFRKTRIFISYARKDDMAFVERLYNDLKDDFEIWWDLASMPNRGLTFLQEIKDAIDHADRLLLVAGPHAYTSDYVRDEWQYAYENYKGINIALRLGDYPDLPPLISGFDAPDFRDDADYGKRIATLKRQLSETLSPIGAFHNVPALPPHFLNRPDELDTLRDLVIADVDKPTLISAEKRTTAVEGMGGIGKSVLATAFAHDRKVRFAFSGGIVWLTAGRDAKMYDLYRAVGVALGDDLSNYPDETTARQNAQRALLTNKKCLLILDDVWELPVGRAFRDLISGTAARLLITTRNLQINDVLNANEYRLKLIDESQAADYLRSWVGDDPDLETVAEKLGFLFLALKLAGARMKKDGLGGADYLRIFNRVSRMKIDPQSSDREDSLEVSITLSVDAAFANVDDQKLLYHSFGIFSEDTPIPQQTIMQLWEHLRPDVDEFDLLEILNALVDLALVERSTDDRSITLHDLLHSYTREKLGDRYVQTHHDMILSYNIKNWSYMPIDDVYMWDHLAYHLINSNQVDDLQMLFHSSDWLIARLKHDGDRYDKYLADLQAMWEIQLTAEYLHLGEVNGQQSFILKWMRLALIKTSISSVLLGYSPKFLKDMILSGRWQVEKVLGVADYIVDYGLKSEIYSMLMSTGKLSHSQQSEVASKGLISARAISGHEKLRVSMLKRLFQYVSDAEKREILKDFLSSYVWQIRGSREDYPLVNYRDVVDQLMLFISNYKISFDLTSRALDEHDAVRILPGGSLSDFLETVQFRSYSEVKDQYFQNEPKYESDSNSHLFSKREISAREVAITVLLDTVSKRKKRNSINKKRNMKWDFSSLDQDALEKEMHSCCYEYDTYDDIYGDGIDIYWKPDKLAGLLPYLSFSLLESAMEMITSIYDEEVLEEGLRLIAPYLKEDLPQKCANIVRYKQIETPITRLELLTIIAEISQDTDIRTELWTTMLECIQFLKEKPRIDLLDFIAGNSLFRGKLLSSAIRKAIAELIIEICDEWQWLIEANTSRSANA